MISTLRLQNYRNHEDTTIEFSHLTALVGPNSAGKSNILEAVRCFTQIPGERTLKLTFQGEQAPVLLLVRDTDAERQSRRDLKEARQQPRTPEWLTVVVGVAHPKREAWVLNGFDPEDADEEEALTQLKEELGCDPRAEAHTLTASESGAKNSLKRVLGVLVESTERERRCWMETDLATLQERGTETGLAAFLTEVKERLLPLFRARSE